MKRMFSKLKQAQHIHKINGIDVCMALASSIPVGG